MSSAATQGSLQIVLRQNIARQIVSIQGWKEVGRSSGAPLHETLNKLTAVETESCAMTYLDVWRSGTFLLYGCKVAFCIQETLSKLSDVERSVILWYLFAISSALACCFSGNVPLLHKSRYATAHDSVLPGLPQH